MTARDEFSLKICCPRCGHSGAFECSENDGWAYARGHHGFRVDECPPGFVIKAQGDRASETKVQCQCGEQFGL
jgi:hypothetical protein